MAERRATVADTLIGAVPHSEVAFEMEHVTAGATDCLTTSELVHVELRPALFVAAHKK